MLMTFRQTLQFCKSNKKESSMSVRLYACMYVSGSTFPKYEEIMVIWKIIGGWKSRAKPVWQRFYGHRVVMLQFSFEQLWPRCQLGWKTYRLGTLFHPLCVSVLKPMKNEILENNLNLVPRNERQRGCWEVGITLAACRLWLLLVYFKTTLI